MSTLRPTNYKILNASIVPAWIGRAYGINMFSAHTGRAVAPAITIGLTALWSWRLAVAAITVAGLVIVAGLVSQWRIVRDDTLPDRVGKETGILEEFERMDDAAYHDPRSAERRFKIRELIRPGGMGRRFQVQLFAKGFDPCPELGGLRDPFAR